MLFTLMCEVIARFQCVKKDFYLMLHWASTYWGFSFCLISAFFITTLQRCHCAAQPEAEQGEVQGDEFLENNPVNVIVCSDLRGAGWEESGSERAQRRKWMAGVFITHEKILQGAQRSSLHRLFTQTLSLGWIIWQLRATTWKSWICGSKVPSPCLTTLFQMEWYRLELAFPPRPLV